MIADEPLEPQHDTRDIERIAERVHGQKSGKVPVWAWRAGAIAASAIVVSALVAADHYRMAHFDGKVVGLIDGVIAQFNGHEARIAKGEEIRERRTLQLDAHETRISIVETRVKTLDEAMRDNMTKIERWMETVSTKIDKLMERRNP